MSSPAERVNKSQQIEAPTDNQPIEGPSTAKAVDSVAISHLQQDPNASKKVNHKAVITCDFPGCKKTLRIVDTLIKCRCEQSFCRTHNFYLDHRCTYDYKAKEQERLKSSLLDPKIPKPRQWHHGNGRNGSAY